MKGTSERLRPLDWPMVGSLLLVTSSSGRGHGHRAMICSDPKVLVYFFRASIRFQIEQGNAADGKENIRVGQMPALRGAGRGKKTPRSQCPRGLWRIAGWWLVVFMGRATAGACDAILAGPNLILAAPRGGKKINNGRAGFECCIAFHGSEKSPTLVPEKSAINDSRPLYGPCGFQPSGCALASEASGSVY